MAEVEYGFFTQQMKMLEINVLDKELAAKEPMWKNAGKTEGLQIWRIQSLRVTSWPKVYYGKFYDGDSYIILRTSKSSSWSYFKFDLHTWIGKYSTEDEYVMAAHKMMELSTYLDDKPVQHREIQGKESKLFKSYFGEIRYMHGGAKSVLEGKEHEENRPRLYHVHGQRMKAVINEIPLGVGEIDDTDVYILESGSTIYQWNGRGCNIAEKSQAMRFINELKEERSGQSMKVEVIDQKDYGIHKDEFFHLLHQYSGKDGEPFDAPRTTSLPIEHVVKADSKRIFAPAERKSAKEQLGDKKFTHSIKEIPGEYPKFENEESIPNENQDTESADQILEIKKLEIFHLPSETGQQPLDTRERPDAELSHGQQAKLEIEGDIPPIVLEPHEPGRQPDSREVTSDVPLDTQLPRRRLDLKKEDKEGRRNVKENAEPISGVIKKNESKVPPNLVLDKNISSVQIDEDCLSASDVIIVKELYRLSDADGEMKFTKMKDGNIIMSDFDGMDVFIFDTKQTLYVWIGNGTTSAERKNAMTFAHNYLLKTDHPFIPVTCLREGMETDDFLTSLQ